MRHDDLDQLGPGTALDAICGREVFGLDILGQWPTVPDQDGGEPLLTRPGDGAVLRPVYVRQCVCDDDGRYLTRSMCGVPDVFGHLYTCLAPAPPYSTDPAAAATVVQACRDAGWFDEADALADGGFIRTLYEGRWWDGVRHVEVEGLHEYAVACVAAVRVARLLGRPLVKPTTVE